MSRRTFQDWFLACQRRAVRRGGLSRAASPHRRPLRLEPLEDRRMLAVLTVDTLVDENDGVGIGGISLRDAILAAMPSDTIDFTVTGTISLEHGELVIDKPLTIDGPGPDLLTIDAGGNSRIFTVDDGDPGLIDVDLSGLTLTGGFTVDFGGAVLSTERLSISESILTGSVAQWGGGIYNLQGELSIVASTVSGNSAAVSGGGLFNAGGIAAITDSIVLGNTAADAGGIANRDSGETTITRTTVDGNMATGGVTAFGSGGGVHNENGTVLIVDSTISGNSANYGAGFYSAGTLIDTTTTIRNSTVSGNTANAVGGGIYNFGGHLVVEFATITDNEAAAEGDGLALWADLGATLNEFRSSIVAGNGDSDVDLVGGPVGEPENTVVSHDFNAVGAGNAVSSFSAPNDLVVSAVDLALGPLADNGGPTKTHALLQGSVAIDTGDDTFVPLPDYDQRGEPFARVFDGDRDSVARMDIGAFESNVVYFVVDTLDDHSDGDFTEGNFSLREAIEQAALVVSGSPVVLFDATLFTGGPATMLLDFSQQLEIVGSMDIQGPGADLLTIQVQNFGRAFLVDDFDNESLAEVSIQGLRITGGNDPNGGGGIFSRERLAVANCLITGNTAQWGGGIYNYGPGELTLIDSEISGNTATSTGGGGGIYNWGGQTFIFDSVIRGNDSGTTGGGVLNANNGSLTIARTTIADNDAETLGGGLFNGDGNVLVVDSTFSGNTADSGGGIYVTTPTNDTTTISNSTISNNIAPLGGAGIFAKSGHTVIQFSTVTENNSNDFAGSGVVTWGDPAFALTEIRSTIVAGNHHTDVALAGGFVDTFESLGYNAIGTGSLGSFTTDGDLTGVSDPMLGPLADNGGPTMTHALLAGSPAIDAGDPAAVAGENGVPQYDQRGIGFDRVRDGNFAESIAIDIGAYEVQVPGPALPGDYNNDHIVNAADYTVWRNSLGTTETLPNDETPGVVDESDYQVWKDHFGQMLEEPGSGSEAAFAGGGSGGPIIVTTLADVVDPGDGLTSLREAIAAANTVGGADTIEFDPALTSGGPVTILLTLGELPISGALTITGPGADLLTIDAAGSDPTPDSTLADGDFTNDGDGSRVFNINISAVDRDVSISGLTLTGGDVGVAGGAIYSNVNLTIADATIRDNHSIPFATEGGGGIFNDHGHLTVIDSTITGNATAFKGGGLLNYVGTLVVSGSTISGNYAGDDGGGIESLQGTVNVTDSTLSNNSTSPMGNGGAIYAAFNNVTVTITRSTISGNSAGAGGGIYSLTSSRLAISDSTISGNSAIGTMPGFGVGGYGDGGGILWGGALLTITNSTISGNSALRHGGGVFRAGGSAPRFNYSTIAANVADADNNGIGIGGGINANATLLTHTIVATNLRGDGSRADLVGTFSVAYSLIGDGTGAAINDNGNNLIGTDLAPIDPLLSPLADNGGPTMTHALLPGSPAIDAGDASLVSGVGVVPEFDQRGNPFNRVFGNQIDIGAFEAQTLSMVVDTLADESDGDYSVGDFSLHEAIELANANPEADAIQFSPDLIASGPAAIVLTMGELAIRDAVTIDGPGAELLTIDASGNDPNLTTPGNGSRIFVIDDLSFNIGIEVAISGLTLTGGDVSSSGGAIFSRERLVATGLVITGNHAGNAGGGVWLEPQAGDAVVTNCTITDNTAGQRGGAIGIQGSSNGAAIISQNVISGNSAAFGGAIAAGQAPSSSTIILDDNTITNNSATQNGGAIWLLAAPGRVTITGSQISGNVAALNGGAIFASSTRDLSIVGSTLASNTALGGTGGGIYSAIGELTLTGSTISGNQGTAGGGIYSKNGELTVSFSSIRDNTAFADGGGIWSENDRFLMSGSTVSGNTSNDGDGGGIRLSTGSAANPATVLDSTLSNNRANFYGGGLYFFAGNQMANLTLAGVTISGNNAHSGGGVATGLASVGFSSGSLAIQGGSITGNTALLNGGGLYARATTLNVFGATISGNRAGGHGGGIALPNSGSTYVTLSVSGGTISGNVAGATGLGGPSNGDGGGMWIASQTIFGNISDSQISNNTARRGGGIFRNGNQNVAGSLLVNETTVSGNTASQHGGGIYNAFGAMSLSSSTVSGNSVGPVPTLGNGGGIFQRGGDLTILNSSLLNNSTSSGRGGGLYANQGGDLSITASTIAGNFARIDAGGVWMQNTPNDRASIHSSTISGNVSALGSGGLSVRGGLNVRHSTITGNIAGQVDPVGSATSGLYVSSSSSSLELDHVILAGNFVRPGVIPDLRLAQLQSVTIRNSLIGNNTGTPLAEAPVGAPDVNGNLIGKPISAGGSGVIDPLLAPLHSNGGPTLTHALLPGSPALDAGALVTGPPQGYDQRGNPFSRMVDGTGDGVVRIDVGAYESQGIPSFSPGDYNRNGVVNAADYTLWRNTLGTPGAAFAGADGDGDGAVDADDYGVWKSHFGQGLTESLGGGSGSTAEDGPVLVFAAQPPTLPGASLRSAMAPATSVGKRQVLQDQALVAWLTDRLPDVDDDGEPDDHTAWDEQADESGDVDAAVEMAFAALQP